MSISLPAACLDALGGLAPEDGAVEVAEPDEPRVGVWCRWDNTPHPDDRIVLGGSYAALYRLLARHVGLELAEGEVPTWARRTDGSWLLMPEEGGCGFGWGEQASDALGVSERPCPTLAPDMSRMRALAEVVVWLARVERAKQAQRGGGWLDGRARPVTAVEQHLGLPAWEVADGLA